MCVFLFCSEREGDLVIRRSHEKTGPASGVLEARGTGECSYTQPAQLSQSVRSQPAAVRQAAGEAKVAVEQQEERRGSHILSPVLCVLSVCLTLMNGIARNLPKLQSEGGFKLHVK